MTGASTYASAGVDAAREEQVLSGLARHVQGTFAIRQKSAAVMLPLGFFANVVRLNSRLALAISTDGIGTKALIAQMLGKYDTVGIDCVAMNANDVICVGAEPLTLVDYIAVHTLNDAIVEEIVKGLAQGALDANISISGGEIAQMPDVIHGVTPEAAFDLAGTVVGRVNPKRMILGERLVGGEAVIGIRSSGIHSNGLTLARKVLADFDLRRYLEDLLTPTLIYVRPVMKLLRSRVDVRGLAHITSDGLLNLGRLYGDVDYEIDVLPEPPSIFQTIKRAGDVVDAEMYTTFNMGVGFCVVVPTGDADRALRIIRSTGFVASVIGRTTPRGSRVVRLAQLRLAGRSSFAAY